MKLIRSFLLAFLMFLVFAVALHFCFARADLKADTKKFGYWFNMYKDLSYSMLSENLREDSILLMGSSEFNHGKKTIFHPKNFFARENMPVLEVGAAHNQTLYHMTLMGSLSNQLKSRKAVLLVSPTWFRGNGVKPEHFALRFSKSEYIAFMENKSISTSSKRYMASRSEELLADNADLLRDVKLIDKVNLGEASRVEKMLYAAVKGYSNDRDRITSAVTLTMQGMRPKGKWKPREPYGIDESTWEAMHEEAFRKSRRNSQNRFGMTNNKWNKLFKYKYRIRETLHPNSRFDQTREYDDVEAFLKLAKDNQIKVKLIILPVNGRWFDAVGETAAKRKVISQRLTALSQKYGAELADLTKHSYEKYITRDAVHPWNQGWVYIDKEIYKFYQEK